MPVFLPYLSGERTPHMNPHATGMFVGLKHQTDRAQMTRAVLEGVAFACADSQRVIEQAGTSVSSISVVGGGARSLYWGRIIATVLNRPLQYHQDAAVGPAFGAARLALMASSGGEIKTVAFAPPVEAVVEPELAWASELQDRLVRYRSTYQRVFS